MSGATQLALNTPITHSRAEVYPERELKIQDTRLLWSANHQMCVCETETRETFAHRCESESASSIYHLIPSRPGSYSSATVVVRVALH